MYTERDFMKELEEQTHPEILRSNLANTVLELVKLGIKVRASVGFMTLVVTYSVHRISRGLTTSMPRHQKR